MGMSSDGILVFGVDLGEELPDFLQKAFEDEDCEDFGDWLCQQAGMPKYGEPGHDFTVRKAFLDAQPLNLVRHCSYDYPMYILGVRSTKKSASRGYAEKVHTNVSTAEMASLTAFMLEHGIEGEAGWLLASLYG